jgi:O-succinylbenzoic acid--CoA ligase
MPVCFPAGRGLGSTLMLVEAWLLRSARAHPSREAVNGLTYAQLLARARAGATALRAQGAHEGDLVGIALEPSAEFVVALHAIWGVGGVAVPVDSRLGDEERAHVERCCRLVVDAPLPDGGGGGAIVDVHDLRAPAAIIHTSGSTAAPKPIELTFGNWLWSALGSAVALGLDRDEHWVCPLPLSHVGGLSIVVRSAIYGTTVRVLPRFDVDEALAELKTATLVSLVPTTLSRLLDAGWRHPVHLRTVLLGGAAIAPALLERAAEAGVPVTPTYGMTEACSQIATAGVPLFCTRVTIAPDGEIVVRGPTVSPGVGAALHTGDLGELDDHGHLHITGRKADTIITGGENVAPTEVEAVLAEHPAVVEAAVHGRPDPQWGEAVVATVVLGREATEDELRAFVAQRLAGFKVPKAIAFTDALPRTSSGKLLRRALE